MRISLVIATRNRAEQLRATLNSINARNYSDLDVVIVDDGSTDDTPRLLGEIRGWPLSKNGRVVASRLQRSGGYRTNPSAVLNYGHQLALGDTVIEQGGEVCHLTDCVAPLGLLCRPGLVALARVHHGTPEQMVLLQKEINSGSYFFPEDFQPDTYRTNGETWPAALIGPNRISLYCGKERPAPFMFLGAIHRKDFEAVGGYDEKRRNRNDEDLANRLLARGVKFRFVGNAVGFHLKHGKS